MKHGTKSQIVKRRLFIASMCIIILSVILTMNLALRAIWVQSITSSDILKQQRFVHSYYTDADELDLNVDLRKENYFGANGAAIKNGKGFGVDLVNVMDRFRYLSNDYNILRLLYKPIPITTIKKNNYRVVLDAKDLVDPDLIAFTKKTGKFFTKYEWLYGNKNITKVRITYNHDYLPVKLEEHYKSYFDKKAKWHYANSYDYPFHSEEKFNEYLDAYIKAIKADAFNTK